jgi:hypothetical protein
MAEIRFSGFGGQGIVRCGLISGKALSLYDNKHATMTQSFGPEARGSGKSKASPGKNQGIRSSLHPVRGKLRESYYC